MNYKKKLGFIMIATGVKAPGLAQDLGISYCTIRNWLGLNKPLRVPQSQGHKDLINKLYQEAKDQKKQE